MAARNSYQYETSPRKIRPDYDIDKNKKVVKKKTTKKNSKK